MTDSSSEPQPIGIDMAADLMSAKHGCSKDDTSITHRDISTRDKPYIRR